MDTREDSVELIIASPDPETPAMPLLGEPLSPRSAFSIMETHRDDPSALWRVGRGLLHTITERTGQAASRERTLLDMLDQLQRDTAATNASPSEREPPAGYIRNNGQALGFYIPVGDDLAQPAYWIRKMPEGHVAGYLRDNREGDEPYITEIYAQPDRDGDDFQSPVLPLPVWLRTLLTGTGAQFNLLRDEVDRQDHWGLYAEVCRYRALHHARVDVEHRLRLLQDKLRGTDQAMDACAGRLEMARLYQHVSKLRTAATAEGRRRVGWDQLGRRGAGPPRSGRGQPR